MKQIPNTPNGWMDFVSRVKSLTTRPLSSENYSVMMREYYILGKSPQDYVNSLK